MYEKLARQLHIHGDLQLEPEYYGRGMSKPTVALIGTQSDLMESVINMVEDMLEDAFASDSEEAEAKLRAEYDELRLRSLTNLRTDNLGSELIFY